MRLYETDGRAVKAQVKFDPEVVEPDSPVVETRTSQNFEWEERWEMNVDE